VILALKSFNLKPMSQKRLMSSSFMESNIFGVKLSPSSKAHQATILIHWKWGEDIQLKSSTDQRTFFYCYICERSKHKQEPCVVSSGRLTAMDQFGCLGLF
jgi:hypothetical protein